MLNVRNTIHLYIDIDLAWMSGFSLPLPYLSSFLLLLFHTTMFERLDEVAGSDSDVQPRAWTVFNTLVSSVWAYEF